MRTRTLGASGLRVPVVSFGAWALGGWTWGGTDDARSLAALDAALEAGISAVDTAPVYGFGHSEELLGRWLTGLGARRREVVVMTKVGLRWDDERGEHFFDAEDADGTPRRVFRNSRPDSVKLEVERSLVRLGVECLDLVQVHWPDSTTPIAETMGALAELFQAGLVRAVGASNYSPAMLAEARAALGQVPLASDQLPYSLLNRGAERDVLPLCREHGLDTLVYSPLAQGLLTGKVSAAREFPAGDQRQGRPDFAAENRARVNATLERSVRPIAERHGATLAQVVLAWTADAPGVTTVLAGARTPEQARENAAAGDLVLTTEEWTAIDEAFPPSPEDNGNDGDDADAH